MCQVITCVISDNLKSVPFCAAYQELFLNSVVYLLHFLNFAQLRKFKT